jgi:hypothetical protein
MDIFSIKSGDKVKFTGTKPFWFTDMIEDANLNLKIGQIYTIKDRHIHSSWCAITLYEMKDDSQYTLDWFELVK